MNEPVHVTPVPVSPEIDRLIHEPARFAILTVLASCERRLPLSRTCHRLTRGNLSVQLTRLEEGGLIEIEKTTRRNRTLTTVALTTGGRRALDSYWQSMEDLRTHAHRVTAKEAKTIEPDPPDKDRDPRPGDLRSPSKAATSKK